METKTEATFSKESGQLKRKTVLTITEELNPAELRNINNNRIAALQAEINRLESEILAADSASSEAAPAEEGA